MTKDILNTWLVLYRTIYVHMGILAIFLLNELSMRQYSLKETGKLSNQILPF